MPIKNTPGSSGFSYQATVAPATSTSERLDYIDNLRSSMIFLVVAFHTTITYSHVGSWYYQEPNSMDRVSAIAFFAFEGHCQAFFMGLLFMLAGYFVPGAFDRKGPRRFLRDRFLRLGLPSLFYILLVQPIIQRFLLHIGDPHFANYYQSYITSGDFLTSSGPMWFALALLAFSLFYALVRAVVPLNRNAPRRALPGWTGLLVAGLAIGVVTFLIRLVQPIGASVLNMQLCFFSQYMVMFAFGIMAFRNDWFMQLSTRLGYGMLTCAIVLSPPILVSLIVWGGFPERGLAPYVGGWQWPSAAYAVWEQLACVALCTGLIVLFREKINFGGRISKMLAANSFGTYFLHAPVVIAVTLAFGWLTLPPVIKAMLMAPITCLSVLVFVHFVARRIPLLKRIL